MAVMEIDDRNLNRSKVFVGSEIEADLKCV